MAVRAELAKVRYLPAPRWIGLVAIAAAVVTGTALNIAAPKSPDTYVNVSSVALSQVFDLVAAVFGVWLASLEFTSGTLQRTLTAEPDRSRVLLAKLGVVVAYAAVIGLAAAAIVGGLTHLAIIRGDIPVDAGTLARAVFAPVPEGLFAACVGFGFGLLTRSLGGGITCSLVFLLVLAGVLAFIPQVRPYSYSSATADLTNSIAGNGAVTHSAWIGLLIALAWTLAILAPGWIMFLRMDHK